MTPERAALVGAGVLDRVGVFEESPGFTDPDSNLAAVGILGDIGIGVR